MNCKSEPARRECQSLVRQGKRAGTSTTKGRDREDLRRQGKGIGDFNSSGGRSFGQHSTVEALFQTGKIFL